MLSTGLVRSVVVAWECATGAQPKPMSCLDMVLSTGLNFGGLVYSTGLIVSDLRAHSRALLVAGLLMALMPFPNQVCASNGILPSLTVAKSYMHNQTQARQ